MSTLHDLTPDLLDERALPAWLPDRALSERLLETLWTARQPMSPAQFFVWSQNRLQALLPHHLLVCVSQAHPAARLEAQVYHLKPMAEALRAQLAAPEHGLWLHLMRRWSDQRGPLLVDLLAEPPSALFQPLLEAGLRCLMLDGVGHDGERPEGLFLLGGDRWSADQLQQFELLTPTLWAGWRRVRAQGRTLAAPRREGSLVTPREQQIVEGLRAGLSNEGIAIQLGISMFTVKNHVRKILRKLGASNRAQAVAIAMARRDLSGG